MASAASLLALSDYPNFLGPLLVKEFRVGLTSRTVVIALVGIQALLSILTCTRVLSSFTGVSPLFPAPLLLGRSPVAPKVSAPSPYVTPGGSGFTNSEALDHLYWITIVGILHVLLPFRYLMFGDEDARPAQADLLTLANLGRQLTLVKWVAQIILSLLLLLSILPYAICRSYCAGVDVVWELMTLFWLWMNSAIFSSLGIAVGSFGRWARFFSVVPLLFFFIMIEGCCWIIAGEHFRSIPPIVSWICAAPIAIQVGLSLSFLGAR